MAEMPGGHVVTVTANAALDRTLWLEEPLVGGVRQVVSEEHCQAGGKGVNVARVLARLGVSVRTVVVLGGATGATIAADLQGAGLEPRIVAAESESRTCTEILAEGRSGATQLHGAGVRCTAATERELLDVIASELEGASWLALCGSLPRGLSERFYAAAIEQTRKRGVPIALDASGAPLAHGLRAAPELVRVTAAESSAALGVAVDALRAGSPRPGPSWWVVSDGANEIRSWTADGDGWSAFPPRVALRNPIGCGDAMLAGLLFHSLRGRSKADSLRAAIALAAADAEARCAGRPDLARAERLERDVALRCA